LRTCLVAIFPNDPTQPDLRRREGDADDHNRNLELAVDLRPVFRDGFRKPPSSADEHPDRGGCYDPDGYSEKASHQLSPSERTSKGLRAKSKRARCRPNFRLDIALNSLHFALCPY